MVNERKGSGLLEGTLCVLLFVEKEGLLEGDCGMKKKLDQDMLKLMAKKNYTN